MRDNVFTPFNLLFCVLAACLFAVGSYSNMMFLGIVVCNTLIGIIQELRVKRELSKITLMAAPTAQVVREGQELRLPVEELVLDDVVRLAASCQIPADAVLLQGALEVNEALLTGEADNVAKAPGTGCSRAALWCRAAARRGWTRWARTPLRPASPTRPSAPRRTAPR